jgi:hypothetical protein
MGGDAIMSADAEQPWVPDSAWLLLEESHSKFPVLADVPAARVKLARKFNRQLPKAVEVDLAWKAHAARAKGAR